MTRRFGLYLVATLLSLHLADGEVWAQTPAGVGAPTRLIRLQDGSLYNGELVEQVPNNHITLKLATGTVRRFEWSEIAEVAAPAPASVAVLPDAPLATPTPALSPFPVGAPPTPVLPNNNPLVRLHTDDQEAGLYEHTGTSMVVGSTYRGSFIGQMEFWNKVCSPPCEQPVDRHGLYSVRGPGIIPSPSFSLPSDGLINLDVKAGHLGTRVGSLMLTGLGSAGVVTGVMLLITGNQSNIIPTDPFFAQQRIKVRINDQPVARLTIPSLSPRYVSPPGLRF